MAEYRVLDKDSNTLKAFHAESDDEAEAIVNESYDEDDGYMRLVRLETVIVWQG